MTEKIYCTCNFTDKYRGLFAAGKAITDNEIQWVCAKCSKPMILYYEESKHYCPECIDIVKTPYEILCLGCFKETGEQRKYRSWKWARSQFHEWETETTSDPLSGLSLADPLTGQHSPTSEGTASLTLTI